MELTPLISSFIILLREGFEAMLIAMLVFMYLDKVKARHKRPAVFWGMGAGVLVSLLIAVGFKQIVGLTCLLYTSPSPRDRTRSRMPSSA